MARKTFYAAAVEKGGAKAHRSNPQPDPEEDFLPSALVASLIEAASPSEPEPFLPAGWSFSVYDPNLLYHYLLPSHVVMATNGSLKYALLHERYGHATRYRFHLCPKHVAGRCEEGKLCSHIHARWVEGSVKTEKQTIHVNENLSDCTTTQDVVHRQGRRPVNTHGYPLLPAGTIISVHAPNAQDEPPHMIDSGLVLLTRGGQAAYRLAAGGSEPPTPGSRLGRPRHCAHFQFRKVCNAGEECLYVHTLAPYVQPKYRHGAEVGASGSSAAHLLSRPTPCPSDASRTTLGRPGLPSAPPEYGEHVRRVSDHLLPSPSVEPPSAPPAIVAGGIGGMLVAFMMPTAMSFCSPPPPHAFPPAGYHYGCPPPPVAVGQHPTASSVGWIVIPSVVPPRPASSLR